MRRTLIAIGAGGVLAATGLGYAAQANATECAGGGFGTGGVCCAYNPWAGNWVATLPQRSGPPVYVGDCNGGVRTPPQYNYGRGPND
jgi:hypothetical protein